MDSGEYTRQLERVRDTYASRLRNRLATLRVSVNEARADTVNEDALRALYREMHSIHGTAGSYGLLDVSQVAALAESRLRAALDGMEAPSAAFWSEIASAIVRAEAAVDYSLRVPTPLPAAVPLTRQATPGSSVADPHFATVLLVDDETATLDDLTRRGRDALVRVVPVRTAIEALQRVKSERFDGAIIDVNLGDQVDGPQLGRMLRSVKDCHDLPLAFLTGRESLATRQEAARAGGSLFLTKPVDTDQLAEAARFLAHQRTAASSRVLVVDDDRDFTAYIVALLESEGMEVHAIHDANQVFEALAEVRPDVALIDVVMPEVSGFDICRMVRAAPEWKDLPLLLITARLGTDTRIAAFEAGADDYLPKPVVREELMARIRLRLERITLARERAQRDPLTGLLLRRPFTMAVQARLAESRRHGRPLSLAIIDLDHFKAINDTHGHLVGDRVLSVFGTMLGTRYRAEDIRGRWGGEEFVIAFPSEPIDSATRLVERALHELRGIPFKGEAGEIFHVSFSAGVASAPANGTLLEELLRTADSRLYRAKNRGRGQVVSEATSA